ncbi:hypothetical protein [Amphibiibacter pelophylacis]|uniref:Uncharacterized protein n=1 Tax=Amphibiibacter pelophylacis TaxID=1799477 RepID=A0ACC6P1L3_9BURK
MSGSVKPARRAARGAAFAAAVAVLLGSAPVFAQESGTSPLQGKEIYLGLGTYGATLGVGIPVTPRVGFRAEVSGLPFLSEEDRGQARLSTDPSDLRIDDFDLKFDASYKRLSFLGDYYPSDSSGFRLTGGVMFNQQSAQGSASILTANATRNYDYEGQQYKVDLDQTRFGGDVRFPRVTPYVGIGWGHRVSGTGLSFFADAGVAIGRHTVNFAPVDLKFTVYDAAGNTVDNAQTQAKQAEVLDAANRTVQDERDRLQKKLSRLHVWPQIGVGLSYRF